MITLEINARGNGLSAVCHNSKDFIVESCLEAKVVCQLVAAKTQPVSQYSTYRPGEEEECSPRFNLGGCINAQRNLCCGDEQNAGQQANIGAVKLLDLGIFLQDFLSSLEMGFIGLDNGELLQSRGLQQSREGSNAHGIVLQCNVIYKWDGLEVKSDW